ncbi:MAG: hypothetical protein ACFUZC_19990 [Chthoniobacteraceae bacterium]
MFTIICAWCGKIIKDSGEGSPRSHIICVPCFQREMKREKISKPRFYPPNLPPQPPEEM